ncbi:hypothetical protein Taro_005965, partial [Colocasia esculenta]|nr:hypothetical protein [Colocasia esculenta]
PTDSNNGYIYAKIYGGFEKIRSSICDLVAVSRLLNATLVIPEIQESLRSKGISSKFKSFSYIYNEDQFIAALTNDVIVVKSLPKSLKEARKQNKFPIISPEYSASPSFYLNEVLPKLKRSKVIGFVITGGGCLQSILPPTLAEYQRLRCRVAFVALEFRPEIKALGIQIVERGALANVVQSFDADLAGGIWAPTFRKNLHPLEMTQLEQLLFFLLDFASIMDRADSCQWRWEREGGFSI